MNEWICIVLRLCLHTFFFVRLLRGLLLIFIDCWIESTWNTINQQAFIVYSLTFWRLHPQKFIIIIMKYYSIIMKRIRYNTIQYMMCELQPNSKLCTQFIHCLNKYSNKMLKWHELYKKFMEFIEMSTSMSTIVMSI